MEGRSNRRNKAAFSNFAGVVWRLPQQAFRLFISAIKICLNRQVYQC